MVTLVAAVLVVVLVLVVDVTVMGLALTLVVATAPIAAIVTVLDEVPTVSRISFADATYCEVAASVPMENERVLLSSRGTMTFGKIDPKLAIITVPFRLEPMVLPKPTLPHA